MDHDLRWRADGTVRHVVADDGTYKVIGPQPSVRSDPSEVLQLAESWSGNSGFSLVRNRMPGTRPGPFGGRSGKKTFSSASVTKPGWARSRGES